MRILGVDPGKTNCAICTIQDDPTYIFNTWKIAVFKDDNKFEQLIHLETQIDDIFTSFKPTVLFHEGISFAEKFGVAESGKIEHIIQRTAFTHGVPFTVLAPMTVRRFLKITGKSKGKTDIALAVYKTFGFEHEDQNCIDAFAIAKCGEAILKQEFELTAPKKKSVKKK